MTLKSGLWVVHGSLKWCCSIHNIRLDVILLKNRDFLIPPYIWRPRLAVPCGSIVIPFITKQVDGVATLWWKKFEDTFSRFDRIPACDEQADRPIDILPQHSSPYAYASRSKIRDFRPIFSFISEMTQDRVIVNVRGRQYVGLHTCTQNTH